MTNSDRLQKIETIRFEVKLMQELISLQVKSGGEKIDSLLEELYNLELTQTKE